MTAFKVGGKTVYCTSHQAVTINRMSKGKARDKFIKRVCSSVMPAGERPPPAQRGVVSTKDVDPQGKAKAGPFLDSLKDDTGA